MKKMLKSVLVLAIFWTISNVLTKVESSLYAYGNLTRIRRQLECPGQFQFKCKSGECIAEDLYCDGKEDCKDGSDETEDCKQLQCFPYLFRCTYGACINGDYECDGKKDCKDNSDETSPKCTKKSECGLEKFRCKSGECISNYNLCDGKADCRDGSDETSEACSELQCPGFTYQCAYGACVTNLARCNGVRDCVDGSDERNCKTTVTTSKPTTTSTSSAPPKAGCSLPAFPQFGTYNVSGLPTFSPGETVSTFTVIQFSCQNGYRLYPNINRLLICQSGPYKWDKTIPECRRACASLLSTDSTEVKCSLGGVQSDTFCEEPVDGTTAVFNCKEFFEPVTYFGNTAKCQDGSWDKRWYECNPVCGKRRGVAQTNILGGKVAGKHDFPWHMGLYDSKTKGHLCGGSIITTNYILTAAHCLSNLENGEPYPKEDFLVAVGKHYVKYNDAKDQSFVQFPRIRKLYVHPEYKGEIRQHDADIALIELQDVLNITAYVQPVCINWNINNRNDDLSDNQVGLVIGWGYTVEDGKPSNELKVLEVPYVSRSKCFSSVADSFKPYITRDKICAGFENSGNSVCLGDSGGGLIFKQPFGTLDERHFLRGIVSVSAKSKSTSGCDSNSYAGYTDLTFPEYLKFIREPSTVH